MKLYSKETLLLGGIYEVLGTPLAYISNEITDFISGILFLGFIICIFYLFFNKIPIFISKIQNNFPKLTYYLNAIGWIPYAFVAIFIILIGSGYIIDYTDETLENIVVILQYFDPIAILISLLYALLKFIKLKNHHLHH